jgi:two-component system sensor histidine kinase MtrB
MRLVVTVAAIAVAAAVAGCATAPSGGPPRRAAGGSSQVQAYVQPLPPPGPTSAKAWGPAQVVLGFLHASASYAFDPAAAKRYLAPALRKKWDPSAGPVAVVGPPTVSTLPYKAQIPRSAPAGQQLEIVKFTGQRLATLSQTGQYQYTPGQNVEYEFILASTDGVWRIEQLPQGQLGLLLTQSDFEAVYQARNLFFYAPPNALEPAGVLVPDPVYAPLQSSNSALNTNLATGLVDGLLNGQGDWLSGATSSAFPAGSHLIGQVTITGRTAKVDLGGGAVHATGSEIQNMETQLQATLGDRSYSAPLATQVQLYINHKLQYHNQLMATAEVTAVAAGPVFAVTGASTVGQLPPSPRPKATPVPRLRPAQLGNLQITAIAAAPTPGRESQLAVAAQDGSGCVVYLNAGGPQYRAYPLAKSGGPCTSLSWDGYGNVWAAAGHRVWVLRSQDRRPLVVDVTAIADVGQPGSRIRALRMAPDGVRVALLVHTSAGNTLQLAAVRFSDNGATATFGQPVSIGAGGADPVAVSWSDPYHLAVLAGGGVFSVPLTGGAGLQPGVPPTSLGPAPADAETLTTDGSELVAGTSDGQIFASSLATPGWHLVTTGSDPVYPG